MIILPERGIHRPVKFLLPVDDKEWREPSQAQRKNMFGHADQTRFSVEARVRAGKIVWTGWFDDFEDFDNFCWALATGHIRYDRYIQRLPVPWIDPAVFDDEDITYHFLTTSYITTGTTTFNIPSNSNGVSGKTGEFIDAIGAGGSGSCSIGSLTDAMAGGAGGAWGRITSFSSSPGTAITVQVGAGGPQINRGSVGVTNGTAGTGTWFNGSSLVSCSVSADFGRGGTSGTTGAVTSPAGGLAANGTGTSKNNGGSGGSIGAGAASGSAGGGGAAGPNGAGTSGTTVTASSTASAGGSGDAGSGGAGTAGTTISSSSAGGAGTEYDGSHGSGGASGGVYRNSPGASSSTGAGGAYGAGSGSITNISGTPGATSAGKAGDGLITYRYEPIASHMPYRRATRFYNRSF